MGFGNVGKVWTADSLKEYLKTIVRPSWVKGICLHHCAEPSLAQRPNGFTATHIQNLKSFYQNEKGWSSAPHLFIDDDQIFGMCPFTEKGVHAVSFNSTHIGIEVLGDYDSESPFDGRGHDCWETTFDCVRVLLEWLKLPANNDTIKFHRDDPKTTKTCPGTKVTKQWVLDGISKTNATKPIVTWLIHNLETGADVSAFDKIGRPFVATRSTVKFLGGDDSKLKVEGEKFSYSGNELELSYIDHGVGYSPVREIVEAMGLRIVSVVGKTVNVGKS